MRTILGSVTILALAGSALACADAPTQSTSVTADRLRGIWVAVQGRCDPCDSPLTLTLSTSDSLVTGFGTHPFEGVDTAQVSGFVTGSTIGLDFTFPHNDPLHFRGRIDPFGRLAGTWYVPPAGTAYRVAFVRSQ